MSPKSLGQDTCGPSKSSQWGHLRDSGLGATGDARAGLGLCGRHLLSWMSLDRSHHLKEKSLIASIYILQQYAYEKYANEPGHWSTLDENFGSSFMNFCLAVNHSEMITYAHPLRESAHNE